MARPRDPKTRLRICAVTRQLLLEKGYGGLSIEGIAKHAGVGKTTIYRRWPSKADLVFDAVYNRTQPPLETLPHEPRRALTVLIQALARDFTTPEALVATSGLLTEFAAREDLAQRVRDDILAPPYALVIGLLEQGCTTGVFRPDIDPRLVADMLFSTPFVTASILGRPMDDHAVASLVTHVLDGIAHPGDPS